MVWLLTDYRAGRGMLIGPRVRTDSSFSLFTEQWSGGPRSATLKVAGSTPAPPGENICGSVVEQDAKL